MTPAEINLRLNTLDHYIHYDLMQVEKTLHQEGAVSALMLIHKLKYSSWKDLKNHFNALFQAANIDPVDRYTSLWEIATTIEQEIFKQI